MAHNIILFIVQDPLSENFVGKTKVVWLSHEIQASELGDVSNDGDTSELRLDIIY